MDRLRTLPDPTAEFLGPSLETVFKRGRDELDDGSFLAPLSWTNFA